jgi:hypothetical protein
MKSEGLREAPAQGDVDHDYANPGLRTVGPCFSMTAHEPEIRFEYASNHALLLAESQLSCQVIGQPR